MAEKTLQDYMVLNYSGSPQRLADTLQIKVMYHGRISKSTEEDVKVGKPWCASAEDFFPNEINVYSEKDFEIIEIGKGRRKAISNALRTLEVEIFKRGGYHFIAAGGNVTRENGNAKAVIGGTAYKIDLEVERRRPSDAKTTSVFLQHLDHAKYKVDKGMINFSDFSA